MFYQTYGVQNRAIIVLHIPYLSQFNVTFAPFRHEKSHPGRDRQALDDEISNLNKDGSRSRIKNADFMVIFHGNFGEGYGNIHGDLLCEYLYGNMDLK